MRRGSKRAPGLLNPPSALPPPSLPSPSPCRQIMENSDGGMYVALEDTVPKITWLHWNHCAARGRARVANRRGVATLYQQRVVTHHHGSDLLRKSGSSWWRYDCSKWTRGWRQDLTATPRRWERARPQLGNTSCEAGTATCPHVQIAKNSKRQSTGQKTNEVTLAWEVKYAHSRQNEQADAQVLRQGT